ncbi:MAG: LysR family transcriptional regulator [Drouetiella hepatica Uher 2000/2452]|jgi:DNA-binding transcriptional LysR family regulator|uniref:LysR family transcriptional regulator n=1 Tax=Drouetiella hepatica Uher 2000/2452 TaxID=904376 RepID=A0A951Q8G1_9CYAN|nr:LysR family transcriptional regulator [Drouetiella hepatica Uher 2000/2452]
MELRHLRYFVAVAEELNFSRAAERLHIAQPPLSQQIRSLETELGVQLFNRNKHRVSLTEVGELFLVEARQTLIQAERAVETAQRASQGELGRLVIGFASSIAYSIFPDILRAFREKFPGVELILHELNTSLQTQGVHGSTIDLGFVHLPIAEERLNLLTVLEEPMMVAVPKTHPLADHPQISLTSLANDRFILFPRHVASGFYDQVLSACQQAGFTPNVIQEAKLMQTIVCLVAGGMGVALVPASLQNLQRTGVIYAALEEKIPPLKTAMIWRQDNMSCVLHAFIAVVRQTIQDSMLDQMR